MVSKMVRKTPTKSIKDCRKTKTTPRRRRTPVKSTSSVVIATINESFFTCRKRLVKIFSKLVKITTPKKSPKKYGFRKLHKFTPSPLFQNDIVLDTEITPTPTPTPIPQPVVSKPLSFPLPPLTDLDKTTIFLDLDETLIHSRPGPPPAQFDYIVKPTIDGEEMTFYVLKRPGVDELLSFFATKKDTFEVVVFTAGLKEYASLVLDGLDKSNVISHRLYRDSCRELDGKFVKDLSCMGRDLWKVVIVDDNPCSYAFQPENAIQIKPFVDDLNDMELGKLVKFFQACDGVKDIRDAVKVFAPHNNNHHQILVS